MDPRYVPLGGSEGDCPDTKRVSTAFYKWGVLPGCSANRVRASDNHRQLELQPSPCSALLLYRIFPLREFSCPLSGGFNRSQASFLYRWHRISNAKSRTGRGSHLGVGTATLRCDQRGRSNIEVKTGNLV